MSERRYHQTILTGELVAQIQALKNQVEALREIVDTQRFLLHQKTLRVQQEYESLKPHLDRVRERIYRIILEYPTDGLTYQEIGDIYYRRYRHRAEIGPRIRELRAEGRVFTVWDKTIKRNRVYLKV